MSLDNQSIFAEQYVEPYAQLRAQYPYKTIPEVMRMAKKLTVEYLYLQLKDQLPKEKKIWPMGWSQDVGRLC